MENNCLTGLTVYSSLGLKVISQKIEQVSKIGERFNSFTMYILLLYKLHTLEKYFGVFLLKSDTVIWNSEVVSLQVLIVKA